jgi:glucosyl-dolichyl phosphate glucuronosyltransferase
MNPCISVVICTYNRAQYLPLAIQSLLCQELPAKQYEIIVVDNCSTDTTREVIKPYESSLRYLFEPRPGLSYARNTGWQQARGLYVAYLDDDAIASSQWLAKILDVFMTITPRPGCVGGKVEPIWEIARPDWVSDEIMAALTVVDWSKNAHVIQDLSVEWLVGANMALPISFLEEIGGFVSGLDRVGKHLLSGGDIFIEKQAIEKGYTCFYHPEIEIKHHVSASRLKQGWFLRRYYWQGVSDAIMKLCEDQPSKVERTQLALSSVSSLLRSPTRIANLILPTRDPRRFTRKCFDMIKLGRTLAFVGHQWR